MAYRCYRTVKSSSDTVRTPDYILDWVTNTFGDYFDPTPFCPDFDPGKHVDGLEIPWKKLSYCNPPFSKASKFLRKCYQENKPSSKKTTIFLCKLELLGRIAFKGGCDIILFHKNVCFPPHTKPPRFSTCLLVFHDNSNNNYMFFEDLTGNEFNNNKTITI